MRVRWHSQVLFSENELALGQYFLATVCRGLPNFTGLNIPRHLDKSLPLPVGNTRGHDVRVDAEPARHGSVRPRLCYVAEVARRGAGRSRDAGLADEQPPEAVVWPHHACAGRCSRPTRNFADRWGTALDPGVPDDRGLPCSELSAL